MCEPGFDMRCVGKGSLLMNGGNEDSRRTMRSMLFDKILLLLGSAEGKLLRCRKSGKSWQLSGGSLTAEQGDWKESAAEGCCQATPVCHLTRSRDERHCNTLQRNERESGVSEGGEGCIFFQSLATCHVWDSEILHRCIRAEIEGPQSGQEPGRI